MKKVVVVTAARSGSNLLLSLLNSHPDLYFHGEVFKPAFVATFRAAPVLKTLIGVDPTELRDRDPVRFIDTVFALSPTHPRAVGFKLFLNHNSAVLDAVAARDDMHIMLLDRQNRLASFSSLLIGEMTDVWWVKSGKAAAPDTAGASQRVIFDAERFEAYRLQLDADFAAFRDRVTPSARLIEIDYSDLLHEQAQRRILRFLGANQDQPLMADLVKQNPAVLVERFENPEVVRAHLEAIDRPEWIEDGAP